jgi:hypothetical protein
MAMGLLQKTSLKKEQTISAYGATVEMLSIQLYQVCVVS